MTRMLRTPLTRRTALAGGAVTAVAATAAACSGESPKADQDPDALTVTSNSIEGGKNSAGAEWVQLTLGDPELHRRPEGEGPRGQPPTFEPQGVDDEDYKTKIALDLKIPEGRRRAVHRRGSGLASSPRRSTSSPLRKPTSVSGDWEGWEQISEAVQGLGELRGTSATGSPRAPTVASSTSTRISSSRSGLPTDWQPTSWDEIISQASTALKDIDGVTPIQRRRQHCHG